MRLLKRLIPESARRQVKRVLHTRRFHRERQAQPDDNPRVVILPSQEAWAASSNLRGYALAPYLRSLGWRATVLPPILELPQRLALLEKERPDVLLMQQSRHPLNRPALYPYPVVFDADDADYLDPRCHEDVIACVEGSVAITVGSTYLSSLLRKHNDNIQVIWTTTPVPNGPVPDNNATRQPIVTWAHASPLGFPHERELIHQVLDELSKRRSFEFWLFGTEPGPDADAFLATIRERGIKCRLLSWMSYEQYLEELSHVAIGLQPVCVVSDHSRGRSFGKILGYLQQHVAVVASNAVDHPRFFEPGRTGYLADSVEEWADAIAQLLDHPDERAEMTKIAYTHFRERLCTDSAAKLYDQVLRANLPQTSGEPSKA